jgi:hypothetical protein
MIPQRPSRDHCTPCVLVIAPIPDPAAQHPSRQLTYLEARVHPAILLCAPPPVAVARIRSVIQGASRRMGEDELGEWVPRPLRCLRLVVAER